MAQAYVHEGEDIEKVLRRFKRQVKDENILQRLRDNETYEKPSEAKAREKRERDRANSRRMRLEDW